MVKILDASAIILFFEKKSGYEKIRALLMTSVNWGEVRYILMYKYGGKDPQQSMDAMRSLPVRLVDVDQELVSIAGDFKVKYKMGYFDAMAAALAKLHNAECVTSDTDFNILKDEIKINLIANFKRR